MMRRLAVLLAGCTLASIVTAAESTFVERGSWNKSAASAEILARRIEASASRKLDMAGMISRTAAFDFAYPRDADEFHALDGHGVIVVSAISKNRDELPLKRVVLRLKDRDIELRLVRTTYTPVDLTSNTATVFGSHRWDGAYLFPVKAIGDARELSVDFARNRDGMVVHRFPPGESPAAATLPDEEPSGKAVREQAIDAILNREFVGVFELASAQAD